MTGKDKRDLFFGGNDPAQKAEARRIAERTKERRGGNPITEDSSIAFSSKPGGFIGVSINGGEPVLVCVSALIHALRAVDIDASPTPWLP